MEAKISISPPSENRMTWRALFLCSCSFHFTHSISFLWQLNFRPSIRSRDTKDSTAFPINCKRMLWSFLRELMWAFAKILVPVFCAYLWTGIWTGYSQNLLERSISYWRLEHVLQFQNIRFVFYFNCFPLRSGALSAEAVAELLKPNDFRIYYQMPTNTNILVPVHIPLCLAYRSTMGKVKSIFKLILGRDTQLVPLRLRSVRCTP